MNKNENPKYPTDRPVTMEPRIAIQLIRSASKMANSSNVDTLYLAGAIAERVLEHGGDLYQAAHNLIVQRMEQNLAAAWEIFWDSFYKRGRSNATPNRTAASNPIHGSPGA